MTTWFGLHQLFILTDGLVDETSSAKVVVVFGNKVNEDGPPSKRLKARLDKRIEIYKSGMVTQLFVSGGLGKEGHFEGNKMSEYLISKGIPKSDIHIDNNGNNTGFTAQNFIKIFPNESSVVLVSQYHHISRAKLAFRKNGVKNVYGVHAPFFEWRDFYSCTREFFAYYKYLIS